MTGNEMNGAGTVDGTTCTDSKAHAALDALFNEALDARGFDALRAHLAGCESCRAQYDRISRVQRNLERDEVPLARKELLSQQLLGRLQASPQPVAEATSSPWLLWGKWLAPVALATAAVVLIVPRVLESPTDEFQPRAGATAESYGVRAFCVAPGDSAKVLAEARPGQTLRCPENAALQFTYTAPSATRLEVFTHKGGEAQSFFASRPEEPTLRAGVDEPLPFSTPVASLGQGTFPVVTRFVDPVSGQKVELPGPTLEVVAE